MANILLIQWDRNMARSMADALATRGHRTYHVSNANDGITAFSLSFNPHVTERFDVIICHHNRYRHQLGRILETRQALKVAKIVRPLFPDIPIIVTDIPRDGTIYVPKPLDPPTAFFYHTVHEGFAPLIDAVEEFFPSPDDTPNYLRIKPPGLWL